LARCGLESIHQVQNGLWLCKKCHGNFDDLEWYVESDQGVNGVPRYFVRVIAGFDREESAAEQREFLIGNREMTARINKLFNRSPADPDGTILIYFKRPTTDPSILPNVEALHYHRAACLIWEMAGGAEDEEECCSDLDSCDPEPEVSTHTRELVESYLSSIVGQEFSQRVDDTAAKEELLELESDRVRPVTEE
jgi:hypothetical protein